LSSAEFLLKEKTKTKKHFSLFLKIHWEKSGFSEDLFQNKNTQQKTKINQDPHPCSPTQ
jgi:hypothetical protein